MEASCNRSLKRTNAFAISPLCLRPRCPVPLRHSATFRFAVSAQILKMFPNNILNNERVWTGREVLGGAKRQNRVSHSGNTQQFSWKDFVFACLYRRGNKEIEKKTRVWYKYRKLEREKKEEPWGGSVSLEEFWTKERASWRFFVTLNIVTPQSGRSETWHEKAPSSPSPKLP